MAFNHEVKLYPHWYVSRSNPHTTPYNISVARQRFSLVSLHGSVIHVLWDAFAISIFLLTEKFKNLSINEVMKHLTSFYKTVP